MVLLKYMKIIIYKHLGTFLLGIIIAFSCIVTIPHYAHAAVGDLDTSFNPGVAIFGANGKINQVIKQTDNKLIIVGEFTKYNGVTRNHIARLNVDGTLDVSFNPGSGANNDITSAALDSDGSIVISGIFTSYNGTPRHRIARVLNTGLIDLSFDPGTSVNSQIISTVVQTDKKIIIGGFFTTYGGNPATYIARLNTDGTLDTTFNNGNSTANNEVYTLAINPINQKIVVSGKFTMYSGVTRPGIVVLNSTGEIDSGFNPGSGFLPASGTFGAYAKKIGFNTTGDKIIAVGFFAKYNNTVVNNIVVIDQFGVRDSGFVSTGTGSSNSIEALAVDSNNKIVISGTFSTYNGSPVPEVIRINMNGSRDTALNNSSTAFPFGSYASTILALSSGSYVIGGDFNSYNDVSKNKIVQVLSTGAIDASFNPGINTGINGVVNAMVRQTDGKIIIAGSFTTYNEVSKNNIVRVSSTGVIDPSFVSTGTDDQIKAMTIDASGNILIAGSFTTYNGSPAPGIARIVASTGSLDNTFTPDGANADINALGIDSNGKIIIGGDFTMYGVTSRNGIARLLSTGLIDSGFNPTSGVTAFLTASVSTVFVQPDNKVLIGGTFTHYDGIIRNNIARILTTGLLDTSFNPISGANGSVYSIIRQPDTKIVVGGAFTTYDGFPQQGITRISDTGVRDTSFLSQGIVGTSINSITRQLDGKLIVGGVFSQFSGFPIYNIARANLDGTFDTSFISSGTGTESFESVYTALTQPDGYILFGGYFNDYNGVDVNSVGRIMNNTVSPASLSFSPSTFTESTLNNGAIANTSTITLIGDTFSNSTTSRTLLSTGGSPDYSVINLPSPLGISIVTNAGGTTATVTLTGNANPHTSNEDVSNLTIIFNNSAFTSGSAASVSGSTTSNLAVEFLNFPTINYNGGLFAETAANTGFVSGNWSMILTGDTYQDIDNDNILDIGTEVLISPVPTGLSPVITLSAFSGINDKVATLTFTGQANPHTSIQSISNLTITFQNAAFVNTALANTVVGYTNATGIVSFNNSVSVAFSASTFSGSENNSPPLNVTVSVVGGVVQNPITVPVSVTTLGTTAVAGTDYTLINTTIDIPADDYTIAQTKSFPITIINDTLPEPTEYIALSLGTPSAEVILGGQTTTVVSIQDDDTAVPTLSFSTNAYPYSEGAASTIVNLSLNLTGGTVPAGGASVVITQTGGTATSGSDYTFTSPQVINIPAGTTSPYTATIPVTILPDNTIESPETIIFSLGTPSGITLGGVTTTTITITDNDVLSVQFGTTAPVTESVSPTSMQLAINVSGGVSTAIGTVSVTVTGGTATSGSDYTFISPYTFSIPAANYTTPQTLYIAIPIVDNLVGESTETINFLLSNPTNASLGATTTTTATILDNDTTPSVSFAASTYTVNESATSVTLLLSISGGSIGSGETVQLAVTGGTASNSSDYTFSTQAVPLPSGTFSVVPGSAQVIIPLTPDNAIEGDESIIFSISTPSSGVTLGNPTMTTVNIIDDDVNSTIAQFVPNSYSAVEGAPSATVTLQVSGGVVGSGATVPITITGGTAANSDTTLLFNVTSVVDTAPNEFEYDVYIINTGTTNLALRGYSFGLNLNPALANGGTLTHTYLANSRDSIFNALPTISASATGSHLRGTTTLSTVGSAVSLSTGVPYKLARMRVTSSASSFTGNSSTAFTNLGSGVEAIQLVNSTGKTQCSATVVVNPGGTPGTSFLVNGSANTPATGVINALSVERTTNVTTTTSGLTTTDYTFSSPTIISIPPADYTLIPYTTPVSITLRDDSIAESIETIVATIGTPTGAIGLGAAPTRIATVSLTDNEIITAQFSSGLGYSATEGALNTIGVTISGGVLLSDVNIPITLTGGTAISGSDYTFGSPMNITIPAGNYTTSVVVPVSINIIDDSDIESPETIIFSLGTPSGITLGGVTTTTITITDNDVLSVQFGTTAPVTESVSPTSMQLAINVSGGVSTAIGTVSVTVTGGTATSGSDYTFISPYTFSIPAANYTTPQTLYIAIPIVDNLVGESTETINFLLSNPTNASLGATTTTTATILDNDIPSLSYSGFFMENISNTGVIKDTGIGSEVLVTLANASFQSSLINATAPIATSHYSTNITSLPNTVGLGILVYVTSSSTLKIVLTGQASNHDALLNPVNNLSITFNNTIFSGILASQVTNSTYNSLQILYNNADDLDIDGVADAIELTGFNNGYVDNSGTLSTTQPNVSALPESGTSPEIGLAVSGNCSAISQMDHAIEGVGGIPVDSSYNFPINLLDFNLKCGAPGESATVTIYYDQLYSPAVTSTWVFRKWDSIQGWISMTPTIGQTPVYAYGPLINTSVTTATFTLTDNGIGDTDHLLNGIITDPIGPAIFVAQSSSGSGGGGGGAPKCAVGKTGVYPNCVDAVTKVVCKIGELFSQTSGLKCTEFTQDGIQPSNPAPISLGKSCDPIIKYPIVLGKDNLPSDVNNLITFLNTYEGEKLVVDGIYNLDDQLAVNRFQVKYWNEIIAPFGGKRVTGTVGNYTKGKINAMNCAKNVGCPYFTSSQKYGSNTNEQIDRIQTYLNLLTGTTLNEKQYNLKVFNAIKNYQTIYKKKILAPYGKSIGTGNWGPFTVKTSNEIMGCFSR
jgi:uncharacterized delta-60 repeat protein